MSKKVLFGLGAVIVAVAGVVIYKKVTKNNEVDEDQEISDLLAENEEVIDALENMILEDELDDDETEEEDEDEDEFEEELIEDSIPSDFNNKIEKYYLQDLIDCIKDDEIKSNIMNEYTNICFDIEKEASENGGEMKPSATLKELKVKIKEIIKNQ